MKKIQLKIIELPEYLNGKNFSALEFIILSIALIAPSILLGKLILTIFNSGIIAAVAAGICFVVFGSYFLNMLENKQ